MEHDTHASLIRRCVQCWWRPYTSRFAACSQDVYHTRVWTSFYGSALNCCRPHSLFYGSERITVFVFKGDINAQQRTIASWAHSADSTDVSDVAEAGAVNALDL